MLLRIYEEYGEHGPDMAFWCPACETEHAVWTKPRPPGPHWGFNGNMEKPTFSPSLKINGGGRPTCHIVVTDGVINYCSDCGHSMAGQAVPMMPVLTDISVFGDPGCQSAFEFCDRLIDSLSRPLFDG